MKSQVVNSIIDFTAKSEGFSSTPYRCSAGYMTIGYGRNLDANPLDIDEISEDDAWSLLEEDLEKVAMYLSEHGLAEFNATLEDELAKAVAKEPTIIQSRSTNPSTGYATISGNGKHTVSKTALGHVDFEKVGATEYRLNLGYTVNVSNNKITSISSISFDIPYISPTGSSWGNVRLPSVVKTSMCSVTANYDITKKMSIPIGQGEITVRSETKNEIFGLITNLK